MNSQSHRSETAGVLRICPKCRRQFRTFTERLTCGPCTPVPYRAPETDGA